MCRVSRHKEVLRPLRVVSPHRERPKMMTQNPQLIVEALKGQQASTGKSTRVCRHFVRGRCTWGAACRFSHEADRASEVDMLGAVPSPKVSSPTFSNPMGGQQALPQGVSSQHAWIGAQQAQLQQQRNAILRAAMDGQFAVRPIVAPDGQTHHTIHLTTLPSPEIAIQLLNEQQLRQQLQALEMDDRIRESGLHYLIGEPSVFWSMIRQWHQSGTTFSAKWDAMLSRARQTQQVDCMFYRSAAGCLSPNCPFEHTPKGSAASQSVMSMATSNALLQRVPSLGFGSSERLDTYQLSTAQAPVTQLQPVGSMSSGLKSTSASAVFQTSPTLDELAAAANSGESWSTRNSSAGHTDETLSKSIWNMLTVSEPQPVAVTTAPSSSIW
jgi:hypothetical protein